MSDKLLYGLSDKELDEMENSIDMTKMQSYDRHLENIEIMQLAKNSLKIYIKRFGKNSNIYDKANDIIGDLEKNINETQNFMDML